MVRRYRWKLGGALLLMTIGVSWLFQSFQSNQDRDLFGSQLNSRDVRECSTALLEYGIEHTVPPTMDGIQLHPEQYLRARALLARISLPRRSVAAQRLADREQELESKIQKTLSLVFGEEVGVGVSIEYDTSHEDRQRFAFKSTVPLKRDEAKIRLISVAVLIEGERPTEVAPVRELVKAIIGIDEARLNLHVDSFVRYHPQIEPDLPATEPTVLSFALLFRSLALCLGVILLGLVGVGLLSHRSHTQ